ncbi:MAG: response regulator [Proteobacteria bacterium]|nr:MAG: response regulator [Pseudomonadota bacterium]
MSLTPRSLLKNFREINADFAKLRLTFIALGIVILANATWLVKSFQEVKEGQRWVDHTYEVIAQIEKVVTAVVDQETGFRGFFLSRGDTRFLAPYQQAKASLDRDVTRLEYLIQDNAFQVTNLNILKETMNDKHIILEGGLQRLLDTKDYSKYDPFVLNEGRVAMDKLRSIADSMKNEEKRLLELRLQDDAVSTRFVDRSLYASLVMNLILALVAYLILKRNAKTRNEETWIQERLSMLALALSGDLDLEELGKKTLQHFGTELNVPVSSIYHIEGSSMKRIASFGFDEALLYSSRERELDNTLMGEVAQTRIPQWLDNLPKNYLRISSDLGSIPPKSVAIYPLIVENQTIAVMEIGLLMGREPLLERLMERSSEIIARNLSAAENRSRLQNLLEETQAQAEELQTQQEELRVTNEELTEQASALNLSQDKLIQQQEELRQTNDQLEDQARILRDQQDALEVKASELEDAKSTLEDRAKALEQASHYKSEFLANMSHELRTPLNSMLILSTLLRENSDGNLSEEQVSFASTIHTAGNDLLSLINDILDLSKVEAGKLDIYIEPISLKSMVQSLKKNFQPLAMSKQLEFEITLNEGLPHEIECDQKRLEQILRNFLSNAFKFTERGSIKVDVSRPAPSLNLVRNQDKRQSLIAFRVTDTGIGIPAEKQKLIFEAFSQADSSTSRKYGGTGLGLTICRELAALLGGEMILQSEFGRGSVFTLVIPEICVAVEMKDSQPQEFRQREVAPISIMSDIKAHEESAVETKRMSDDRDDIKSDDKVVLIVEDDPVFMGILSSTARRMGFKVLSALDGEQALSDLKHYQPSGVLLDMKLPGVSGLGLIETIKSSSETRHIPVHVISGVDVSQNALRMGALGYLMKPVSSDQLRGAFQKIEDMISRRVRRVLIVEDDEKQRHAISRLIQGSDVETDAVGLASQAQDLIRKNLYDCMILDLRLPDKSGLELLDAIAQDKTTIRPPVIVYTGKELSRDEIMQLRRYSDSIIIKGVKSPERLVDEVSLFLHRVEAHLPETQQQAILESRKANKPFNGQKVLLVDDDLRNTFALMSALEPKGLKIQVARNGFEALAKLNEGDGVDLVLMDIMMPEMDGYTAMKEIRKDPKKQSLPIIALTAKAMRGDQERCLEAGANDYLPKPIDLERLLSVLKAWLPQSGEF